MTEVPFYCIPRPKLAISQQKWPPRTTTYTHTSLSLVAVSYLWTIIACRIYGHSGWLLWQKQAIYYIFASQPGKNELMAISIPINFIKFRKYVYGFTTSKADGSSLNTKQSERIMPSYFQKCPQPVETTLVAIHFCGEQKNCGQPMFLWLRIYRQPSRTAGGPPTQGITIYGESHKTEN
jgi:hypothetical protein